MNRIEPEKQKITCVEYQFWSSNQSREGPQLLGGRGRAARCPFPSWHCSAKCLEEKKANSSSGRAALQGSQLTPQRCGAGAAVPALCNREQRRASAGTPHLSFPAGSSWRWRLNWRTQMRVGGWEQGIARPAPGCAQSPSCTAWFATAARERPDCPMLFAPGNHPDL